jgi:hypothetical protein
MTLDERLEASTHSVELLASKHGDSQKRSEEAQKRSEDFQGQLTAITAQIRDSMARLANIAVAHDERLDDHQQRIENLAK